MHTATLNFNDEVTDLVSTAPTPCKPNAETSPSIKIVSDDRPWGRSSKFPEAIRTYQHYCDAASITGTRAGSIPLEMLCEMSRNVPDFETRIKIVKQQSSKHTKTEPNKNAAEYWNIMLQVGDSDVYCTFDGIIFTNVTTDGLTAYDQKATVPNSLLIRSKLHNNCRDIWDNNTSSYIPIDMDDLIMWYSKYFVVLLQMIALRYIKSKGSRTSIYNPSKDEQVDITGTNDVPNKFTYSVNDTKEGWDDWVKKSGKGFFARMYDVRPTAKRDEPDYNRTSTATIRMDDPSTNTAVYCSYTNPEAIEKFSAKCGKIFVINTIVKPQFNIVGGVIRLSQIINAVVILQADERESIIKDISFKYKECAGATL